MSTVFTRLVRIDEILPHPNADRLELARVGGWLSVVGKGQYRAMDVACYIPEDSVLPPELEERIFGAESKVRPHRGRIKTVKIRGAISQGLIVELEKLPELRRARVGEDVTAILGITKYEPPAAPFESAMGKRGKRASEREINPHFKRYTDIERIQNYPGAFEGDEEVVVTEKIHGTNLRAGWVPAVAPRGFFRRLGWFWLGVIGRRPRWQFVYGSNKVQLHEKVLNDTFYDTNVYKRAVEKYHLRDLITPGTVVYGEVYGKGIQKGYDYGVPEGQIAVAFFDARGIIADGDSRYFDYDAFEREMVRKGLPVAPVLYRGPFGKLNLDDLFKRPSALCFGQKVIEGVVIRPATERRFYGGRKVLKALNPDYLMGDQTDFH